MKWSW